MTSLPDLHLMPPGNALLTGERSDEYLIIILTRDLKDQQEYLDAGVDRCAPFFVFFSCKCSRYLQCLDQTGSRTKPQRHVSSRR